MECFKGRYCEARGVGLVGGLGVYWVGDGVRGVREEMGEGNDLGGSDLGGRVRVRAAFGGG